MQQQEQMIHLKTGHTIARYRIRFQDCNPRCHVHLHRLADLAQDSDDHSCGLFGCKSEDLRARGICWILLANTFSFTGEWPEPEDTLIVDSWPRGTHGIRLFRENIYYRNTMDKTSRFGAASSEWVFCTLGGHRPLRPSSVCDLDQLQTVADSRVGNMESIPRLSSVLDNPAGHEVMRYQVQLGDLDTNTHLHSSHYVRLAIDAVGAYLSVDPWKEELIIRKFHIQFMNEASLFDELVFYVIPDSENDRMLTVEGRHAHSNDITALVTLEYELAPRALPHG